MRGTSRLGIGVGVAGAVALGLSAWSSHAPSPKVDARSTGVSASEVAPTTTMQDLDDERAGPLPSPGAPIASSGDDEPDTRERGLAAISEALRQDLGTAVTRISETDLATDGYVAAKAIRALTKLSLRANETERARIAERLASWLEAERRRSSPDALGNVSILAEELGKVNDRKATQALVAALDGRDLPLHVEARIVESLGEHPAPEALAAVERFRDRIPAPTGDDAFDDALRREARAIAEATREKLSRG